MKSYDYIIVGAGSAGCVLAARLTESDARVLLLESGPPDTHPNIWNPSGWPGLWGTERDYAYETIPQSHANRRKLSWPRGRTLGGSSALNGMIYVRGHRTDYDSWAKNGCIGWDYASVLPYFKKSENYELGANDYHGTEGPLNVARIRTPHPICATAVEAAMNCGFPLNEDFNGANSLGVGFCDLTIKDGRRHSTAAAFLSTAIERPNLEVLTGASVTRLVVEGTRCKGIEYQSDGILQKAAAECEVILAGGSIGSPHLLMLSGLAINPNCALPGSISSTICRASERTCTIISCAALYLNPRRYCRHRRIIFLRANFSGRATLRRQWTGSPAAFHASALLCSGTRWSLQRLDTLRRDRAADKPRLAAP